MKTVCKRLLFACIFFFIVSANILAQDSTAVQEPIDVKNLVYLELGGNAVAYSLNYERNIIANTYLRVGAGGLPHLTILVCMVNYFIRSIDNSGIILGFGGAVNPYKDQRRPQGSFIAKIGYRYSPRIGGTIFEVSMTPFVDHHGVMPWIGLSIGTSF